MGVPIYRLYSNLEKVEGLEDDLGSICRYVDSKGFIRLKLSLDSDGDKVLLFYADDFIYSGLSKVGFRRELGEYFERIYNEKVEFFNCSWTDIPRYKDYGTYLDYIKNKFILK